MFSGIVEVIASVRSLLHVGPAVRLTVSGLPAAEEVVLGESIAVNGVCLTVAGQGDDGDVTFDLMPETLHRTNLGSLEPGSVVNLERSLRFGDRVGGHFVQGHVDGTAEVVSVEPEGDALLVRFRLHQPRLAAYLVEKGFVAVDGVSLTVVETRHETFLVSLVRTTIERTLLGSLRTGAVVNIEVDVFARYLVDRSILAPAAGDAPPSSLVEEVITDLRMGRPVILLDDPDREDEGDLVMAAEFATPEWIAFFIREARGVLCVAMEGSRLDALAVPLMIAENTSPQRTPFTVSVDAVGTSTGVSAADRARTVRTLADPAARPSDLLRPGHVFPLRAAAGGLQERRGHTEAAVELCRAAGLAAAAVIAEIIEPDGRMARRPELETFARTHGLRIVSVAELADSLRVDAAAHPAADGPTPPLLATMA